MVDIPLPSAQAKPAARTGTISSLVKVPGVFGAAIFGIACISLSFSGLLPFSTLAGRWAGASLTGILTVALLVSLIHAWTYAAIGAAAPRTGADYVLSSRVLGAPVGFAASFTFVFFCALFAGSLLVQIPRTFIPMLMNTAGMAFGSKQLLALAAQAATPSGMIVIGTTLGVIAFGLSILHPRTVLRILAVGVFASLLAWAILFFQLATSSATAFPSSWNQIMGTVSYGQRIAQAQALGMVLNPSPLQVLSAGLLSSFLVFFGYFTSTFFSGEVKQPGKSLLAGSWSSLLVAWAVFMLAAVLVQRLVPAQWVAAESYLYQNGSTSSPMPWVLFYASVMKPQAVLFGLAAVAWLFSLINLVQSFFFFCSRVILAWSRDRLVPAGIRYIHPQMRSPLVATLIVAILAELGLLLSIQTGFGGTGAYFIFFVAAAQLIPVTAAVLYPYRKRAWFEASEGISRLRWFGLPAISITGAMSLAYLLGTIVLSFLPVAGPGRITVKVLLAFVVVFLAGLAWYFLRSRQLKRSGIDLSAEFTSLPAQ